MQKNGQANVTKRVKVERALELRLAGATYRNIANTLGVSCSHAFRLVDAAVKESAEKCAEAAEKIRTIELARLDKMRVVLWPRRADPRVADTLLRISERTGKLYGLDAPTKHELAGADGGPVQTQESAAVPDLSKLTVEELKELERLEKKMRGNASGRREA